MADEADKQNGAEAALTGAGQAQPRGLLRGRVDDSSPRLHDRGPGPRRGRRRGDRPARGRLRRRPDLPPRQGALGGGRPDRRLRHRHLPPGRLHRNRGNRRRRQDHRLRPQRRRRNCGENPNEYIAVSNRCAHLGCPVRFVEAAGNFICPCHGGVYDFEGKVIGGPPVRPLDRFQTRVEGGQVELGPRYSVTSQLEPVRARDPGEFTGGIWEYLYPPRPSTFPPP